VYTHQYRPDQQTFSGRKDKTYHITKSNKCEELGITLFHIWEYDWKYKQDLIKSMLKYKFGKVQDKIYARKCHIKLVEPNEKNIFLDNNHIQGRDKSLHKLGLYYNGELVSLLTMCKSRYNKHYEWEISRFCSKQNLLVIGAFSKLLSNFRKMYSGSIVTYADRFYSNGNVYVQNGMKFLYNSPVSYRYAMKNSEQLFHRTIEDFKERMEVIIDA
jgi:hypothetical protein